MSYLSVTERNRAKFQFEILPCQNDRPFTPHNARGGKRGVECVQRNARGGMDEATCERRNARGGMAAYRNKKARREKKVSLETSPPLQKLSTPFWPHFFSRQWRGKMERFLQNLYTKHLQNTHVRSLWRGFAPGSSNSPRKKKFSSPPGAHVRST
jgi:hypothetical protein